MDHTPGPLEVAEPQDTDSGIQTFTIIQRRQWQDLSIAMVNADEMCGSEEAHANAILFAAASDMLAALQDARHAMWDAFEIAETPDKRSYWVARIAIADAAIAKATPKS